MSEIVIITATGARDRPGIVAALTKAVFEAGGNLDDATMTRLHGAFTTMLAARMPSQASVTELNSRLEEIQSELGLHIHVESIPDFHEEASPDHVITVYGSDRPGIVYRVTALLSELGVNITDLDTRVAGTIGKAIYIMVLETNGGNWSEVRIRLAETAISLGVEVSHREIDTESL